jgi:hypothetical protein
LSDAEQKRRSQCPSRSSKDPSPLLELYDEEFDVQDPASEFKLYIPIE